MNKKCYMCMLVLAVFLYGCESTGDKRTSSEDPPKGEKAELDYKGINVIELVSESEKYTFQPESNLFYGSLDIDTTLSKEAVRGPESEELYDHVYKLFGSKVKQFGVSVTPIIDDTELPKIVLFSYKHDSKTNSWESTLNAKYRSPIVNINTKSSLAFKFTFVASDQHKINITDHLSGLVEDLSGIKAADWVVSTLSKPIVKKATDGLDKTINLIASYQVSADVEDRLEPIKGGHKKMTYLVTYPGKKTRVPLAKVVFHSKLSTSAVNGDIVEGDKFYSKDLGIKANKNPINVIRVASTETGTLREKLNSEGFLSTIYGPKNAKEFTAACLSIKDLFDGKFGLNYLDKLTSLYRILQPSNYTKDSSLYGSGCLTPIELQHLEHLGLPLRLNKDFATTPLNSATMKMLSGYVKSPLANKGFIIDLTELFEESVSVTHGGVELSPFKIGYDSIGRETLLNMLANVQVATACCWGSEIIKTDGTVVPYSRPIFFRPLLSKDILYSLELYRKDENSPVHAINIAVLGDENLSSGQKNLLLKLADAKVFGYKLDARRNIDKDADVGNRSYQINTELLLSER